MPAWPLCSAWPSATKRDKLAYNPETEDTVSVITGDIVQHGDPQDDKTVMEHITENLPIGKKGDK